MTGNEGTEDASDARYRARFESLDQGFCVIEVLFDDEHQPVDYRFIETNRAFVQQTGLADPIGRTIREMVPDIEARWIETYGRVVSSGEPTRFQMRSDALHRWYDAYAFREGAPEERRVAIVFTDVTAVRDAERERERLVRALEVERARLAYVFQQAPAFLAVVRGPDHVFELVNDAYYQLVGHRELLGKPAFDALPEVREQGFKELLDGVLTTGQPWIGREVPIMLARTPGAPPEQRFLDFSYLPLVESDGERTGVIAHGTDVTEQVLARREVERLLGESERARADADAARNEAESANRAKSEFLAVMSHELRTPLNAIQGYAELIELGIHGPITEAQRTALTRIQQSQRHLLGLIAGVLDYSRVEAGAVTYHLVDVPVAEAVAEAEVLVAPQLRAKGLGYSWSGTAPGLGVRADREKLQQILLNLLSNAVKFTNPRDGVAGRIAVTCTVDDGAARGAVGCVHIHVRDTGEGIAPDKLEQVFEPFVQVDQRLTRRNEGIGLGLAISRDLARGMGGDLTAESTLGVGSTLTLTLPRAMRPAHQREPAL